MIGIAPYSWPAWNLNVYMFYSFFQPATSNSGRRTVPPSKLFKSIFVIYKLKQFVQWVQLFEHLNPIGTDWLSGNSGKCQEDPWADSDAFQIVYVRVSSSGNARM